MTQYTVNFTEPVRRKYIRDQRWNKETRQWEYDIEAYETADTFTFYSLKEAKKMIKQYPDKYKGCCITKTYANGEWVNCGEINLKGCNKRFVANSAQTQPNY